VHVTDRPLSQVAADVVALVVCAMLVGHPQQDVHQLGLVVAMIPCNRLFMRATLVPGRGVRCTVAAAATGRGSTHDGRRILAREPIEHVV
jgi:hypothetical protein